MEEITLETVDLWKVYGAEELTVDIDDLEQLEEISSSDDYVIAAREVSFSIEPEITFALMGLSGSGKSTVIRCLIRLLEPTAGTVRINGYEVTALDPKSLIEFRRSETAMVFQHYGLLPHRTILENASFGLKLRGMSREERNRIAQETLQTVGLDGWENSYPASLSGGMQQRVGIARALATDNPVLLMDEPFSGLDPLIRREMQDELIALQANLHKTIIFVTHDLDEAIRVGSKLAVMKDGRIVQQGNPEQILRNPADEYVKRFVRDKKEQLKKAEAEEDQLQH